MSRTDETKRQTSQTEPLDKTQNEHRQERRHFGTARKRTLLESAFGGTADLRLVRDQGGSAPEAVIG